MGESLMQFNRHKELEGRHATIAASKYSWINYTPEKFEEIVRNSMAAQLGTRLHAFAAEAIALGQMQPRNAKTLNRYINDCIGMRMQTEVVLKYNDDAFGTADAIRFDEKTNTLYVFDLKTGVNEAKVTQLEIYAALFCYEYHYRPGEINFDLRIYQNDECFKFTSDDETLNIRHNITAILGRLQDFTQIIYDVRKELTV
jgi:hypothetical protein